MLGSLLGRLYRVAVSRLGGSPGRAPEVEENAELRAAATSAEYVSRHLGRARNLVHREALLRFALEQCSVPGLTLEFGVYRGASLCAIADQTPGPVYGFDSFEGLPEDWTETQKKGRFSLAGEVPRLERPNVVLVKGWFQDTLPPFLAEHREPARFIHVDCDLYGSTVTVLANLASRIVPGTVILFDEYLYYPGWEQHEHKAFQEFVAACGLAHEYIGYASAHYSVAVLIGARQEATAQSYWRLGQLAQGAGDHGLALRHYDDAIRLRPGWAQAHCNAALALYELGRYEASRARSEAALRAQPALPEASHNLGLALLALGEPRAALASFERTLEARPGFPECVAAAGHALRDLGRIDDAIARYDAALELAPELGDAAINRCYARLLAGDFERGWAEYERRFEATGTAERGFPYPAWTGDALAGRTLLIYAEQGLGDEIMFASCLPEVAAAAGGCVIECHTRLERLYRRSFPGAFVHGAEKAQDHGWLAGAPRIDVQSAVGSLPLHLRRTRASFPRHAGYLRADPARVTHWAGRTAALGAGPKVGLSWRGGTAKTRRLLRSIDLGEVLSRLAGRPVRAVSLQYGECEEELAQARAACGARIEHWPEALRDLDETAALICALDFVITVDNTVAHLAGALGRPGLVLLSSSPEWRYLARGTDMPWYPSLRLIRQPAPRDWRSVLNLLATEVERLPAGPA